jgi:hypothetical protein
LAKINFDGLEYDLESVSAETRAEFEMLVASEQRMRELQKELAFIQTARNAYAKALQKRLPAEPSVPATSKPPAAA